MKSDSQVRRLLALIPYLASHGGWADLAETARIFGVGAAQLRKDVEILQFVGDQDRGPENLIDIDIEGLDEGDIFLSNADFLTRPLRFTKDEALSLIVGLQAVAELAAGDELAAARSALEKLRAAAGEAANVPVAVVESAGDPQVREALAKAINDKRVVAFDYDVQGEKTVQVQAEPKLVTTAARYVYLQAWSRQREGWRTYRLDRIGSVTILDEPAQARGEPPPFDPDWVASRPGAQLVTLAIAPKAAWLADYWPVREVRKSADAVEVDLLVADQHWLTAQLLRLGPDLLDVQPAAALEPAAAEARDALARYGAPVK
ncbi:MAG: WYL domain-containing protein [Propionibacteriaceae bacterium]|jgi:proteasome accessory factor C|nr:WYL domain-containing protein [Propionibacteriaceae bacterium]